MSRRRPGRGFPSVTVDAGAIMAEIPYLRALIRVMGCPSQDEDDIMQEISAAAWAAMTAGRYRPDPAVDPKEALRGWLAGIVRRQVGHYRQRARVRRREVLCDAYLSLDVTLPASFHVPAPDGPYAAREILAALAAVPINMRIALVMNREGWTFAEMADLLGICPGTAATRVRRGRRYFLRAVLTWRRHRS